MDIAIFGETIDIILERIPSFQTITTAADFASMEMSLKTIQASLHKNKPYFENNIHERSSWGGITNVVNGLTDLVEELTTNAASPHQDTSKFYFLKSNHLKNRQKHLNSKIHQVIPALRYIVNHMLMDFTMWSRATLYPRAIDEFWKLVPREKEKKEIIDQLLLLTKIGGESSRSSSKVVPVSVVTIIGFDGIKELVNLICSDMKVKAHFSVQIQQTIETTIVEVEESIQKRISESPVAEGKGYLVVLKDLRLDIDEEDLLKLQKILSTLQTGGGSSGGGASAILITTSSKLVANNITATIRGNLPLHDSPTTIVKPYVLQGLNEEDSWPLYTRIRERLSEQDRRDTPYLRRVVNETLQFTAMEQKIVMGCGGVPLWIIIAAKTYRPTMAGMKENFLQGLKIILYNKFPSLQKLCFAFCSLFPPDHLMDVERIIRLMTAEGGLIFLMKEKNSEDILRGYFNDFVGRHVFKDIEEDECGVVKKCRMQPLMHDLARFVANEEENITVDPEGERVDRRVLRASFDFTSDITRGIPNSLYERAKKLRAILLWKTHTLIPKKMQMLSTSTCGKIFKNFRTTLRLLDLHDLGIKTLPTSIEKLTNLRYLDLSLNKIVKLPSSITKLSNLQTLKLSHCYLLQKLPKNIHNLTSLKHLELEGCLALTHMPDKIYKLSSLQTLSLFVVSKGYLRGNFENLSELSKHNNLTGDLEILHLERLNSKLSDTKDRYFGLNKRLQCVTLRWGNEDEKKDDHHMVTMNSLKPDSGSKLRSLFIVGYKGTTLSNWVSSIECLVKLSLYGCSWCNILPPLNQLPKLRFLELLSLDSLEFIDDDIERDFKANKQVLFFPSLEELTISDCPTLKSWWKTNTMIIDHLYPHFPCISKLHIRYCRNLLHMPLFPSLHEELVLMGSKLKPLTETLRYAKEFNQFFKLKSMQIGGDQYHYLKHDWPQHFSSLEKLDIREFMSLESLPKGFGHLTSLQSLTIENCQNLDLSQSESEWKGLKNLRSLVLREIPMLQSLPLGLDEVTSLQVVELHNCPEISYLPESIANLKSLNRLVISECHKLASLPKQLKKVESLETLIILDCSLLLPRCQRDTGDDWPQICHVPNIQVTKLFKTYTT